MRNLFMVLAILCTSSPVSDAADKHSTLDLNKLVGSWHGKSAEGQFEEKTTYAWNRDRTYLIVSMTFFLGEQQTGTGQGYMIVDDASGALVFNMVSSQGVAIDQRQIAGDSKSVELKATALNQDRAGMPANFRTRIHWQDDNHYWTELLIHDSESWVAVMQNNFERQNQKS